jgi:NADH-quinone oxidoreductase subunit J
MMLGLVESDPLALLSSTAFAGVVAQSAPPAAAAAAAAAAAGLSSTLLVLVTVVAAAGTYMLLPGRRPTAWRAVGGVLLLFAFLMLGLSLVKLAVGPDSGPGVYFWIFAAIALVGALRVITHPRPVYAALYFVLTVFATAGLFILLWAEFMAAALVLIYAGAILVTYVFVIMLAASSTPGGVARLSEHDALSREPLAASAVGFALMGVVLFVIFDRAAQLPAADKTYTYVATTMTAGGHEVVVEDEVQAPNEQEARRRIPDGLALRGEPRPAYTVQALGRYLFRAQGINLELAGLLLTIGMVGAILIARRRVVLPEGEAAGAAGGAPTEALMAPATPISDDPFSIPVYGTDNPRQKAYPET